MKSKFWFALFLLGLIGIFYLGFTSAYLPHAQNTNFDLVVTSNNGTICNATYVQYPNGTKVFYNLNLTNNARTFYTTILSGNFSKIGDTCIGVTCTDGVLFESGTICRQVTYNGTTIDSAQSTIYIVLISILLILFLVTIFSVSKLPSQNFFEDEDSLLSINKLKYLKPILYGIAWMLLTAIVYIGSNLAYAYTGTQLMGDLLYKIFYVMFAITFPMIIISFLWILYRIFEDKKLKKMIEMGFDGGKLP